MNSVKNKPPTLYVNAKTNNFQQISETFDKCNKSIPFTASFIIHDVSVAVFVDSIIGKMHEYIASVGIRWFLVSARGKPCSKDRNPTHSDTTIH